jgi:hypothetical protein
MREKTTMGFRRSDLQEAFFVPGSYPFRAWGYGTTDPLADVLHPSYFRSAGGLMHPGDLIYVAVRPQCGGPVGLRPPFVSRIGTQPAGGAAGGPPRLGPEGGEMRMSLVMVRAGENGAPSVRLVQDLGCPDDPDAPLAAAPAAAECAAQPTAAPPQKRGRCRPPGSRTSKRPEASSG